MTKQRYIEPVGNQVAGWHTEADKTGSFTVRLPTAWEIFQKDEGIPVFKGIGVKDSRELPRGDWPRLGGKGSYIQLIGTNNDTGMFIVEVPARGALKPQKHMYEERYLVLDGRGSTEVWKDDSSAKTSFEWQQWSCFSIPLNANFRIINASSSPALLLAVNSAPRMINIFQNRKFIFDCAFNFEDRFGGDLEEYWKPGEDFEPQPVRGRAMITTNVIPDASTTYLPLDNNRGPGFRWVAPNMVGNTVIQGWIGEYPSGRYAKAHAHGAGAVLVCMRGKGFSITWPAKDGGLTPWENGKGDLVQMQEYVPGGMISAAPGPADWFHQHFAYGRDPFRIFHFTGPVPGNPVSGGGGSTAEIGDYIPQHREVGEGGNAIPYHMQDPHIRKFFESKLAEEGAESTMPEEVYTAAGASVTIMAD
jgi:mannose-6-phosphate isomerase-like protein (cupin superfamily)